MEDNAHAHIFDEAFDSDREEVIKDVMNFVAPGFSNAGTYMTFRYVTVESLLIKQ